MRKLLPHPGLTVLLILTWLMLVNEFKWGSLVFGTMLGVILPLGRFAAVRDDGAANANRRRGAHDVDIAAPDREHLTDAGRRAEHHLDDRAELSVRFRPRG